MYELSGIKFIFTGTPNNADIPDNPVCLALPLSYGGKDMKCCVEKEIDFANGHLFCMKSQEGDENDLFDTLDVFKRMKEYYNKTCVVRHWKQRTIESGGWIESRMRVQDAIWQMKEGWLERATYEIDT